MKILDSSEDGTVGDLVVAELLDFTGTCLGSITVASGGILKMRGVCVGLITVQRGGILHLIGVAYAGVMNEGGVLEVRGVVRGEIVRRDGYTIVHPDAILLPADPITACGRSSAT